MRDSLSVVARVLVFLSLLVTGFAVAQDMPVKFYEHTAVGRYHVCRLDGVQVSQHSDEREANETSGNLKLTNPDSSVICKHEYEVVTTLTPEGRALLEQGTTAPVTLSWNPPVANSDGTPLIDLAGYRIYYGTEPGVYSASLDADDPTITTLKVNNLPPGTHYFAATSVNAAGVESTTFSNEASKLVE